MNSNDTGYEVVRGIYLLRYALLGNSARLAKGAGTHSPSPCLEVYAQRPELFFLVHSLWMMFLVHRIQGGQGA